MNFFFVLMEKCYLQNGVYKKNSHCGFIFL
jgi:hypothetical protein